MREYYEKHFFQNQNRNRSFACNLLFLGCYAYMIARPISYGMTYLNSVVYEGYAFEGTITFYPNGKVISKNSTFDDPFEMYYYYKDGYVFTLIAKTDEDYEAEVARINENFDEALATPFYASTTNAFKQVAVGLDEAATTYTCKSAIIFALAGGALSLVLVALTATAFSLSKKAKAEK